MTTAPIPFIDLRQRETATASMIRQIDSKLARLDSGRRERAAALKRIRCELYRAHRAEKSAPDANKSIRN